MGMYDEYCLRAQVAVLLMLGLYCTVWDRYMEVLYLGRAPRTKETLLDFREKCRVTRHSRVFRGLTSSQRTPGIWDVTVLQYAYIGTFCLSCTFSGISILLCALLFRRVISFEPIGLPHFRCILDSFANCLSMMKELLQQTLEIRSSLWKIHIQEVVKSWRHQIYF